MTMMTNDGGVNYLNSKPSGIGLFKDLSVMSVRFIHRSESLIICNKLSIKLILDIEYINFWKKNPI